MADNQSLILALNARYEQAWEEYNRVDAASYRCDDITRSFQLEQAKTDNQGEVDALRRAILYQVPNDEVDALVLLKHLHDTFGLTDDFEKEGDIDRVAFEVGLDTLLDYLFGEACANKVPGRQMERLEQILQVRRRLRTGMVEVDND